MAPVTTLLVSRDAALVESIGAAIRPIENLRLSTLDEVSEAYDFEDWNSVALVVVHCDGPARQGEVGRLLRMIQAARRPIATLVIADYDEPALSVTLLQLGAADYLTRPLDVEHFAHLAESLTLRTRVGRAGPAEVRQPVPSDAADPDAQLSAMLGLGAAGLVEQIRRVSPQDATVLLSGETGTGKTRLARIIHDLSRRRDQPFLIVNCGALSSGVVESELFGHIRGSHPEAEEDRAGKFAEVGRGTLFIDEIDTLSPALQAKLLRVVENREFEILGTNRTQPVLARLIAASNRPLEQEVAEGRFRSDLYFRLNVVNFHLPPLRDHRATIAGLAAGFVASYATHCGRPAPTLHPDAVRALENYNWPGNIRELRNVVERAVVFCRDDAIRLDDLPDAVRARPTWSIPNSTTPERTLAAAPSLGDDDRYSRSTLAQIKRDAELARISEALRKHFDNRLRAASELGISRMTLYKKLYKYGLMTAGGRSEPQEAGRNHAS